jgi:hypothetical protein
MRILFASLVGIFFPIFLFFYAWNVLLSNQHVQGHLHVRVKERNENYQIGLRKF